MSPILEVAPLQRPWQTLDPFLVVAHHADDYPRANNRLGPDADLTGRTPGNDFSSTDGWNMYFGGSVPGFPRHPHRGFETVTYARRGWVDHSDSLGAAGRYGHGDVQWMTAGSGINHAEMFPLLAETVGNPLDLFQIWLNLPARSKFTDPGYLMLWRDDIPVVAGGSGSSVTVVAGQFPNATAPSPPSASWADDPANDVGIWHIEIEPRGSVRLPRARATSNRMLYTVAGGDVDVDDRRLPTGSAARLEPTAEVEIAAGDDGATLFVLQGRPIAEPVAVGGPFVMNTDEEVAQAYADYRRTSFGGWPWSDPGPTHGHEPVSFTSGLEGPGPGTAAHPATQILDDKAVS